MKKLLVLLLALFTLNGFSHAQNKTFSSKFGFKVTYPAEMEVEVDDSEEGDEQEVSFSASPDGKTNVFFEIEVADAKGLNAEQFYKKAVYDEKYPPTTSGKTVINGAEYFWLQNDESRTKKLATVKNGRSYLISIEWNSEKGKAFIIDAVKWLTIK